MTELDYQAKIRQVQDEQDQIRQELRCQAWNASTGTFDISRLNMTWAKSIKDRWDKQVKKFAKGMKDRSYQRVQLANKKLEESK